jgi:hypothetical protein
VAVAASVGGISYSCCSGPLAAAMIPRGCLRGHAALGTTAADIRVDDAFETN